MPVSIDGNGFWVGDGHGGMVHIQPTVTKIDIEVPGQEHIAIADENGIVIEKDSETGQPIVHAESITIASEAKPKHFWQSWLDIKKKNSVT